jgi:hypothetical protein
LGKRSAVPSGAFGEFLSASTVMIVSTDVNNDTAAIATSIVSLNLDAKRVMVFASAQAILLGCELCLDD